MAKNMNTSFTIDAPAPIDSRMQVPDEASLNTAIAVKYNRMRVYALAEDTEWRYFIEDVSNPWHKIDVGSGGITSVFWADIQGEPTDSTSLTTYLVATYAPISHTHITSEILPDANGFLTWLHPNVSENFILLGSTNSGTPGSGTGATEFIALTDTPAAYLGNDKKRIQVSEFTQGGELIFIDPDFTDQQIQDLLDLLYTKNTVSFTSITPSPFEKGVVTELKATYNVSMHDDTLVSLKIDGVDYAPDVGSVQVVLGSFQDDHTSTLVLKYTKNGGPEQTTTKSLTARAYYPTFTGVSETDTVEPVLPTNLEIAGGTSSLINTGSAFGYNKNTTATQRQWVAVHKSDSLTFTWWLLAANSNEGAMAPRAFMDNQGTIANVNGMDYILYMQEFNSANSLKINLSTKT